MGIVALAGWFCIPLFAQETCLLPAYAHNDYENRRPLVDAVEAGYAGVEADVYLVNGQLLVGHDAADLRRERTLRTLYFEPLRRLLESRGSLCSGRPFLLNIETKQHDPAAFDSLLALEQQYRRELGERWTVLIVHVGWVPPEHLGVNDNIVIQHRIRGPDDDPGTDGRIGLVSVRYGDLFRWKGRGELDPVSRHRLEEIARRTHEVPGRRLRVYDAPSEVEVYRMLLKAGVDLIGVKDLGRGREVLQAIKATRTG
jgi:hypothetical protein